MRVNTGTDPARCLWSHNLSFTVVHILKLREQRSAWGNTDFCPGKENAGKQFSFKAFCGRFGKFIPNVLKAENEVSRALCPLFPGQRLSEDCWELLGDVSSPADSPGLGVQRISSFIELIIFIITIIWSRFNISFWDAEATVDVA